MGCRISSENHHKGGSRRVGSSATRSCITDFFWTNMFKVIGSDDILSLGLTALNSSQQIDQLLSILLPSLLLPCYFTLVHTSSHGQLHRWQPVRDVHRYSRCVQVARGAKKRSRIGMCTCARAHLHRVIIPDGTLHNMDVSVNSDDQSDARRRTAWPSLTSTSSLSLSLVPILCLGVSTSARARAFVLPAPHLGASSSPLSVECEWLNLSCIGGIGTLPG